MRGAFVFTCSVVVTHKAASMWVDSAVEKEIRWQLFEIESANQTLYDLVDGKFPAPEDYDKDLVNEIYKRHEVIDGLIEHRSKSLWYKVNNDPPSNPLYSYI